VPPDRGPGGGSHLPTHPTLSSLLTGGDSFSLQNAEHVMPGIESYTVSDWWTPFLKGDRVGPEGSWVTGMWGGGAGSPESLGKERWCIIS
jgi:hypothetical protein